MQTPGGSPETATLPFSLGMMEARLPTCPHCRSTDVRTFERLNPAVENVVHKCRTCGHVWSPREAPAAESAR